MNGNLRKNLLNLKENQKNKSAHSDCPDLVDEHNSKDNSNILNVSENIQVNSSDEKKETFETPRKKCGRPPKNHMDSDLNSSEKSLTLNDSKDFSGISDVAESIQSDSNAENNTIIGINISKASAKKRGRPPKKTVDSDSNITENSLNDSDDVDDISGSHLGESDTSTGFKTPFKRRGRPPKNPVNYAESNDSDNDGQGINATKPKRRGRPRKYEDDDYCDMSIERHVPKKRGRKRKEFSYADIDDDDDDDVSGNIKKRNRLNEDEDDGLYTNRARSIFVKMKAW